MKNAKRSNRRGKEGNALLLSAIMLVLLFSFFLSPLQAESGAESGENISERLDRLMRQYKTTGASVIAAQNGEIVFRYFYGYEDRGRRIAVSPDTFFRVASVTKMISAVHFMQLEERGLISLDQDLSAILGYQIRNPYTDGIITPRMLMSHTSSLQEGEYHFPGHTLRELIGDQAKSRRRFTRHDPGSTYLYSNFGAGLMGSLMEKTEGINVDEAVKKSVFSPLGMDAGYSVRTLSRNRQVANLYNQDGSVRRGQEQWNSLSWDESCDPERHFEITVGDLLIRPEDLCRLGSLLACGGETEGVRLLRAETVRKMMSDQKGLGGITADSPYGLCIHRDTRLLPGYTLYGHQGHMWGTLCSLYWEPSSRMVIMLVSNGCRMVMDDGTSKLAENVWELLWNQLPSDGHFLVQEEEENGSDGLLWKTGEGEADETAVSSGLTQGGPDPDQVREALSGSGMESGRRLEGLKIGIDPGHQAHADPVKEAIAPDSRVLKARTAPGTRGVISDIPEYVTDLEISFALREALIREGAEVLMTRESHDVNISNQERAQMMNEWDADLVLRIHCNGSSRKSMHGIGLYVNKSYDISVESLQAAKMILIRMIEKTGAKERGVFWRVSYTRLNWSEAPCILVECGYLTNPEEEEKLNSPEYQRQLAEGMLEGICDYFHR